MGTSPMVRAAVPSKEDDALAAAVELLSCSFKSGTPGIGDVGSPIRGAMAMAASMGGSAMGGFGSVGGFGSKMGSYMEPLPEEMKREDEEDVDMEDAEEEEEWRKRRRSEEDEEGVFGRMEE